MGAEEKALVEGARLPISDLLLPPTASQPTSWVMMDSGASWNVCLRCPSAVHLSK